MLSEKAEVLVKDFADAFYKVCIKEVWKKKIK